MELCNRTGSLSQAKDVSPGQTSKNHSLVAASSFHDWIASDKDSEAGPAVAQYTPTQYFKSLRMNGNVSEIEPLEEERE